MSDRAIPTGVVQAGQQIAVYLMGLSARRRTAPIRHDVLGGLLEAEISGRLLTDEDVFRVLVIILFGGLDTTTAVMLEALRLFSANPSLREWLLADEMRWPTAIEELIRYTSPVQGLKRRVTKDTELANVNLEKGDDIFLLFGSANRDEDQFAQPEKCVLDRSPNPHLGFGLGAHTCLGRNLARLEIDVVLRAALERLRDFTVKDGTNIEYAVGETRGIKSLPVYFTPGSRRR